MNRISSLSRTLFPLVSFAGLIFVSAELIMQLYNSSLCGTEGCKIVTNSARYGDITMLLPGIAVFLILTLLSEINLSLHEKRLDSLVNFTLIAALLAEGFFVGYQAFRVHTPCVFCLAVFAVFAVLSIMRIIGGHTGVFSGFAGFVVIFSLFYLVLPAASNCNCIRNNQLVLFYSENCPHCKTIKSLCKDCDLQINEFPAEEHSRFLKNMNIDEVPVLFINGEAEKRILIGEVKIQEYLSNISYNKEKSAWMSELFSTSAHAGTCKAGESCED